MEGRTGPGGGVPSLWSGEGGDRPGPRGPLRHGPGGAGRTLHRLARDRHQGRDQRGDRERHRVRPADGGCRDRRVVRWLRGRPDDGRHGGRPQWRGVPRQRSPVPGRRRPVPPGAVPRDGVRHGHPRRVATCGPGRPGRCARGGVSARRGGRGARQAHRADAGGVGHRLLGVGHGVRRAHLVRGHLSPARDGARAPGAGLRGVHRHDPSRRPGDVRERDRRRRRWLRFVRARLPDRAGPTAPCIGRTAPVASCATTRVDRSG